MEERSNTNFTIGQFYSINKLLEFMQAFGLNEGNGLFDITEKSKKRERIFEFFYGKDIWEKIENSELNSNNNTLNNIMLGQIGANSSSNREKGKKNPVMFYLELIKKREMLDEHCDEIKKSLSQAHIDNDALVNCLEKFLGISFISKCKAKTKKTGVTLKARENLEGLLKLLLDIDLFEKKLEISRDSDDKREIRTKLFKKKAEFNKMKKKIRLIQEELEVYMTDTGYFDLITERGIASHVFPVFRVEIEAKLERLIELLYPKNSIQECDVTAIDKFYGFRFYYYNKEFFCVNKPDYIDVFRLLEFCTKNENLKFGYRFEEDNQSRKYVVLEVKSNEAMESAFNVFETTYTGKYGKKYKKMMESDAQSAVAFAFSCIACCSGITKLTGYLFDDKLLQVVQNYENEEYLNTLASIRQYGWRYGQITEENFGEAFLCYICAEIVMFFERNGEKRTIARLLTDLEIGEIEPIRLYESYYEAYLIYRTRNSEEEIQGEISSFFDRYIGACCYQLAKSEMKRAIPQESRMKGNNSYISIAERKGYKEIHILKGDMLKDGIVFKKNSYKAYEEYVKSGLIIGYRKATFLLRDMQEKNDAEFFLCWKQHHGSIYTDPKEELLKLSNGINGPLLETLISDYEVAEKDKARIEIKNIISSLSENEYSDVLTKEQFIIVGYGKKTISYLNSLSEKKNYEVIMVDTGEMINENTCMINSDVKIYGGTFEQLLNSNEIQLFDVANVVAGMYYNSIAVYRKILNLKLHFVMLDEVQESHYECLNMLMNTARYIQQKYCAMPDILGKGDMLCLSNNIDIVIDGVSGELEEYIDSVQARNGDFYLPIRFVDYDTEVILKLLSEKPLWLPLNDSSRISDKRLTVALLGGGEFVVKLLKDIIAIGNFGRGKTVSNDEKIILDEVYSNRIKVLVVDANAYMIRDRIKYDCPEFFADIDYGLCEVEFIQRDLRSSEFSDAFSAANQKDELPITDYYICAMDKDEENLRLAKRIRNLLFANVSSYSYMPMVTAICRDGVYAERMNSVFCKDAKIKGLWYLDLNIYTFGSLQSIYNFENLHDNFIQKMALRNHCSYFNSGWEDKAEAMCSYYRNTYYRDSSVMAGLCFFYRMFSAGLVDKDSYWEFDQITEAILEKENILREKVRNNNLIQSLAIQEHTRWCGFVISRGWRPTKDEFQMNAYLKNGATTHQLFVGKLHPYLKKWTELGERHKVSKDEMANEVMEKLDAVVGSTESKSGIVWLLNNDFKIYYISQYKILAGKEENPQFIYESSAHLSTIINFLEDILKEIEKKENEFLKEYSSVQKKLFTKTQIINKSVLELLKVTVDLLDELECGFEDESNIKFYKQLERLKQDLIYRKEQLNRNILGVSLDMSSQSQTQNEEACFMSLHKHLMAEGALSKLNELYAQLVDVVNAHMECLKESSATGVQQWTDRLLWKYLPQKLNQYSVKENNRKLIRRDFKLFLEYACEVSRSKRKDDLER